MSRPTSPQSQTISPAALQNRSSAPSLRHDAAINPDPRTDLPSPPKRVKTVNHEPVDPNMEDKPAPENGYSENEEDDSADEEDQEAEVENNEEFLLELLRAQPNSACISL